LSENTVAVNASLFVTCVVDQFYPEVGESTVRVLRRLGVNLDFPSGQTCCGQPAFNSGFWKEARPLAERFLKVFRGERLIVAPSGSCASMVRVYYGELLRDDPRLLSEWRKLVPRVYELSEFIVDVLGVTDIGALQQPKQGSGVRSVTYHEACHLRRELGVIQQPRTLIESLTDVHLVEMDRPDACCGFGGTFSVKYPEISGAMLQDKIDSVRSTAADTLVACDCTCLMQVAGGMQKQSLDIRAVHLAQLLDQGMSRE